MVKDLSERYDVSLIPMREALSRLSSSGFVEARDQQGFRVSDVSASDLADITRARILIESEALELSLRYGDVAWESQLVAAHHRLSRLPVLDSTTPGHLSAEWDEAHMAFHHALISACGSPVLLELASNLRQRSTRYRHVSVTADASAPRAPRAAKARNVPAEHQALVDAALARDSGRAIGLLQSHFEQTVELALAAYQARPATKKARARG